MAQRDPEDIKQEIDRARDQLAATVDTLTERANPRRIADDIKASVINFVRKPPVTYALIGVGTLTVVLVIRRIRNH
ncbi:MAG: hypothetical protein QOE41_831 [Mycobacterium sp.]|nr:hypothetical protein [Mycobacterium sp.]MDT5131520.1 hypothetical protein [Mycobacterium sp.]